MSLSFTVAEVAQHKGEKEGMYIIVDDAVYDVADMPSPPPPPSSSSATVHPADVFPPGLRGRKKKDFLDEHPGGANILKRMAGKDASKQFWKYHDKSVLEKYGEKLKVGNVAEMAKL